MKKTLFFFFLFFLSKNIFSQHIADELLLQVSSKTLLERHQSAHSFFQIRKELSDDWAIFLLAIDTSKISLSDAMLHFSRQSFVRNVQKNHIAQSRAKPNDSLFTSQWNVQKIKAPALWDVTQGGLTSAGDTIVVGIIETDGFDYRHPDLINNIWRNHAEIPNNGKDDDQNGYVDDYFGLNMQTKNDKHFVFQHGTGVAGIIGAQGNNKKSISGINWNIKMTLISEAKNEAQIVEGYAYFLKMRKLYNETAGKKGAFIVTTNASLGFSNGKVEDFPLLCGIYDALGKIGILNVAATDNVSKDVDKKFDIPSNCPSDYLLIVTNATRKDSLFSGAAFGNISVDLAAPGEGAITTFSDNRTGAFGGCSAAAPHVAGAIALLYSVPINGLVEDTKADPAKMALKMKKLIMDGVDKVGDFGDKTVSGGRLNVYNAFQLLGNLPDFEVHNVFPNPTNGILSSKITSDDFTPIQFLVFNMLGEIVKKEVITPAFLQENIFTSDLSPLANGLYLVKIEKSKDVFVFRKIIKM